MFPISLLFTVYRIFDATLRFIIISIIIIIIIIITNSIEMLHESHGQVVCNSQWHDMQMIAKRSIIINYHVLFDQGFTAVKIVTMSFGF